LTAAPSALEKTRRVVEAALATKAEEVVALDVRGLTSVADAFVLATGTSDRQLRAIADAIADAMREVGERPLGVEGYDEGRWVLIDLNDVIVHVFLPEVRTHYDLERLWGDAPELHFEGTKRSATR
jgi:ribosome-associated protein